MSKVPRYDEKTQGILGIKWKKCICDGEGVSRTT
jgi:hypothetical protein